MKKLQTFLDENQVISSLNQSIHQKKVNVHIKNTNEENALLYILHYFLTYQENVVLVCPNLYSAQMVYDKISTILNDKQVSFFPQDEFITSELLVSSMELKMERMSTIATIFDSAPRILVTHLAGLMKPELEQDAWKEAIFTLKTGGEISRETLMSKLFDLGYSQEYTVEKPGDYSVRGGIVDIYLIGEKHPFRLDFFGDEIDTIKRFDIESQRSFESVGEIKIIPFTEFIYQEDDYLKLEKYIKNRINEVEFTKESLDKINQDLAHLKDHTELDRLTRYIPFITQKRTTILDYVEKPTVFFMDNHRIKEQVKIMIEEIKDWYLSTSDYPKMGFDLIYPIDEMEFQKRVDVDYFDYADKGDYENQFSLFGKEILSYRSNLDLFVSDIRTEIGRNTLIIAVSSKKNFVEIKSIFDENKIPYVLRSDETSFQKNALNLIESDHYFDLNSDVLKLHIITDSTIFQLKNIKKKGRYVSVFETSKRLSSIHDLKPGDYIVHYDYGIGKFLEVKTMDLGNVMNDYIHLEYRDGDKLYIPLESIHQIQKYSGSEGFVPRLSKLGGSDWAKTKQRVRDKAKDIADQLIKLYAERENSPGFAFLEYADMEREFENDFPYSETIDQKKAILEVLQDMKLSKPMDRLLCGDVGFGKTEVALRAAFRAVLNNKQVAYLAPTTVLSKQHFHTFRDRMEKYGIQVALLNRFVTKKEQTLILKKIKEGTIDVLIGTHRILSKDILFKDLGLLVIDEEQRFGVLHKERIKEMKVSIDVLSLSATPIPRTLQMAIMGVKNMSLLETAPENRYPIQTYVLERNEILVKDAIERELMRGGQVFYLYNKIEDIDNIAAKLQKLVPEARIQVAHGRMHKDTLERVVDDFIEQEIDVLLSTTIIETGIDIPNANTLIVHDADRLGLSQLYQIRGRVGRTNRIAYAYLMYKKEKVLTEDAVKRLKVIKEFTELGSGFKIAIRDLSIRGAGDVLGSEQSGFIDSVGIDLYMRILEEEIKEKQGLSEKQETAKGVKARVSKYIDQVYIEDDFIKIEMHKKIQAITNMEDVQDLLDELKDRFGKVDEELHIYMVERLFEVQTKFIDIEKIHETKTNITFIVSVEGSKFLAGDTLFASGYKISPYIRFSYKEEKIHITIDTIELKKHWLFTATEFFDLVIKNMNKNTKIN
ncbi:MAG: transcription-repair coupling factor [Candidatus Izemoplasmatales bacterium]